MSSTAQLLSKLLQEKFDVDPAIIHDQALVSELGLDSLTLMEFIFAAEDALGVRIPEEALDPTQEGLTLGKFCTIIDRVKAGG